MRDEHLARVVPHHKLAIERGGTSPPACEDDETRRHCERSEASVSGYAVLSTEDDESAGGYFVTGTMKDLLPTW